MKKTIMFFGAHADDMEIRAGGTMRKFADKGYDAVSVMLTNNLCGGYASDEAEEYIATGPAETSELRHREAREAAEVLGAKLVFMDFMENSYFDGEKRVFFGAEGYDVENTIGREPLMVAPYLAHCIEDTAQVLIEHEPEIVITHNIANCNPEHCAAAHLTHRAFLQARGRADLGELWFTCRVQSSSDIIRLSPDVLIDITDYHETKWEALQKHRSQRIAYDRVRVTDEYWGKVAGVKYAEPFRTIIGRTR